MTPAHSHDLRAWNQAAAQAFGDIAVQSGVPRFEAEMASRDWPGVRLVQVDSPAATVSGAQRGGQPGWFVLYNESGPCCVKQAARRARLDVGEMSLLRADRPWEIHFDQPNRMLVAAVPLLDAPGLDEHEATRHGPDETAALGALLRRLRGMDDAQAARLDAHALRRALLDLLQLARPVNVPPPAPPEPAGRQRRWLERMAAIVQRDLTSPALDAQAIAHELRLSKRYVQLIFEGQGTTLTAYILERRLHRATDLLRRTPPARIADVALDAGFGDLSYFCRSFRRRFGCSAREWQRRP